MTSRRFLGLCLASFVLAAAAIVPNGPSTPEERQRVLAIAHKLEAAPLDQTLYPERDWARQWVIENPDVRIKTCNALLVDLRRPRYKFRQELNDQLMLSSAAFLIEHPDQTGDHLAEEVAGIQGVLKAYTAILKSNPDVHAQSLDNVLEKQSQGKLAEWVRETIKVCRF